MLITRIITAVLLLCAVLPALFWLPPLLWRAAVAAVITVAAWEWARMARLPGRLLWPYAFATGLATALLLIGLPFLEGASEGASEGATLAGHQSADTQTAGHQTMAGVVRASYGIAFLFWLAVVPLLFATGVRPGNRWGALAGWCVLLPFGAAVADLRDLGPGLLISVMALVWVADIAAYFAGRALGRRKLAPGISPGKTWAGAVGGVAAVALYALANWHYGNPLLAGARWWSVLLLAAGLLAVVSIIGDLFESAMKRAAGFKDSSHLLPGHGGVMDRIDSLTSTLPVAALLLIWSGKL